MPSPTQVGAEAAVTTWRRHLLRSKKSSPVTVNQALAAVTLLYEHGPQVRIVVRRAWVPKPGEPDALEPAEQGKVERAGLQTTITRELERRDAGAVFCTGPARAAAGSPVPVISSPGHDVRTINERIRTHFGGSALKFVQWVDEV